MKDTGPPSLPGFIARHEAAAIFLLTFALYAALALANGRPFVYDEGTYAVMISEFAKDPSAVTPTVTGVHVEWKPPLFTWVYSVPYAALNSLKFPSQEAVFRLPSAFFGACSAMLLYLVALRLHDKRTARVSALLFIASPLLVINSAVVMMESFAVFLILAAILLYVEGKLYSGMVFIGLLCLTKWLYVAAPVIFLIAHFWGKKELPEVLRTFIVIPAALLLYLGLASVFGDLGNALGIMLFDVARPVPGFNLQLTLYFYSVLLMMTFPLSSIALVWRAPEVPREVLAWAALAFVLPLSHVFLPWYPIISLPALALIVGLGLSRAERGAALALAVGSILFLSGVCGYVISMNYYSTDSRALAGFSAGKNLTVAVRESDLFANWGPVNSIYRGTDRSYLILEQLFPGILYYRFNNATDYGDLHAIVLGNGTAVPCKDYLAVLRPEDAPSCFHPLGNVSGALVYAAG